MIIFHDHPCMPINVPGRGPLATSFTYNCRCGKLMIVDKCKRTDTKIYGQEFFITLGNGEKVKPDYVNI